MIPSPCRLAALAGVLLLTAIAPARAVTWNVNPQGTGDAPTIQAACDSASYGDVILLAPGVYKDRRTRLFGAEWWGYTAATAIAFLRSGITLTSSGGADVTILDGEGLGHCLMGFELPGLNVSGITFRRGANPEELGQPAQGGGAIVLFDCELTLEDCVFTNCRTPYVQWPNMGGAVYLWLGGPYVVQRCLFKDNGVDQFGGALALRSGVHVIRNNTFVGNRSGDVGGAVSIFEVGDVTMDNNIFVGNEAVNQGGAVDCHFFSPIDVSASCNLFWENLAPVDPHVTAKCPFPINGNENLIADPLFCGAGGSDFSIRPDSPAAPDDPSGCGLRGAFGVACGPVSVRTKSWGQIKSDYRSR